MSAIPKPLDVMEMKLHTSQGLPALVHKPSMVGQAVQESLPHKEIRKRESGRLEQDWPGLGIEESAEKEYRRELGR